MAEILSGGLNWGSTQQAIVTMDKEGHPLTCCNPVTGECLGGGGSSDIAHVTATALAYGANSESYPHAFYSSYLGGALGGAGFNTEMPEAPLNNVILYNGVAFIELFNYDPENPNTVVVEGDAEIWLDEDEGDYYLKITGDCTISIAR